MQASIFFHQKWLEKSAVCSTENQAAESSGGGVDDAKIQFKNFFSFTDSFSHQKESVIITSK